MEAAVQYDSVPIATRDENQEKVRDMVLQSYQDMIAEKGRKAEDFFSELESRYMNA